MPVSFLDTNILVYLASGDATKAAAAEKLLATEGNITSVQVLNECTNVARRKMGLSWPETHAFLGAIRALLSVVPLTDETHETGLRLAERHKLPVYDAMIAAAALLGNCTILWSEDFHHGLTIDGRLRIKNPFRV
jgi:predicted nucleic acid-binding protein